jgi:hypothetical protein
MRVCFRTPATGLAIKATARCKYGSCLKIERRTWCDGV